MSWPPDGAAGAPESPPSSPPPPRRWWDGPLDVLEAALRNRRQPSPFWGQIWRRLRQALWLAHGVYLTGLLVTVGAMVGLGENHWLTAFLLFWPPLAFLLPTLLLAPAALLLDWRQLGWSVAAWAIVGVGLSEWRFRLGGSPTPPPEAAVIRLLTNNVGQNNRLSMRPFLNPHDPHLILIQEGHGREHAFGRDYSGYFVAGVNEFVLLSRWEIIASAPAWPINPYGARFVVRHPQLGPVAVYNVHLPTPRRALDRILGRGILGGQRRADWESYVADHRHLVRQLVVAVREESLPWVLGGDFNMVSHGALRRELEAVATDAHRAAGSGSGLTFPGITRNPLSFFGPWLRIDYLWAGPGWQVTFAATEPDRASQHRAVAATYVWSAPPPAAGPARPASP